MDLSRVTSLPAGTIVSSLEGELGVLVQTAPLSVTIDFGTSCRAVPVAEADTVLSRRIVVWKSRPEGSTLARVARALLEDARARRSFACIVVVNTVVTLIGVSMPLFTRRMVGHAIPNWAPLELLMLALSVVVLGGHNFWLNLLRKRWFAFLQAVTEQALAREVVHRMLRLPLREIDKRAGDLPSLISQTRAVSIWLSQALVLILDMILGLLFLAVLAWIDPIAALVVSGVSVVALAASLTIGRSIFRLQRERMQHDKAQARLLQDVISGCEAIKANGCEDEMTRAWRDRLGKENRTNLRLRTIGSLRSAVHNVADRFTFATVLLTGGIAAIAGAGHAGDIVASLQAAGGWGVILSAGASAPMMLAVIRDHFQRMRELEELDVPAPPAALEVAAGLPLVLVDGLWFRYAEKTAWVLRDFSMKIERGARLLIRWPSGRGKTTFLRLISGLHLPDAGRVLVDGRPAHERASRIAYLPQSSTLLPVTIRENLHLFSRAATEERIARAISETGLSDVLDTLPLGLDTPLTAGSRTLSSGQSHLVLLTAVLASDAELLLLDEAFSHLDGRLQARFLNCPLLARRTVVVVTHEAASAFGPSWTEVFEKA
jgi:ABC-type bacteriocin/lantibiotic exporter with double-glycine peptidase domain